MVLSDTFKRSIQWLRSPGGAALILILVAAASLEIVSIVDRDLHVDETHYARCAGEVGLKGNFLLRGIWNDRGLVQYYVIGLFYFLFGISDLVSFLPNMLASLLLVVAVFAILRLIKSPRAGLLGASFLVLCPMFITYAPTVFNEPLVILWVVLAVWAAIADRPVAAGLLLGLGVCTKQVAPIFAPLVGACLLASSIFQEKAAGKGLRSLARNTFLALLGLLSIFLPMLAWSYWIQWPKLSAFKFVNRPEAVDLSSASLFAKAVPWLGMMRERMLDNWQVLYLLLIAGVPVLMLLDGFRFHAQPAERKRILCRIAIYGFTPCFLMVLAAGRLPHWDRYIYPLIPTAIMTLALVADELWDRIKALPRRLTGLPGPLRLAAGGLLGGAFLWISLGMLLHLPDDIRNRLSYLRGGFYVPPTLSPIFRELKQRIGPKRPVRVYYDNWPNNSAFEYYFFATNFTVAYKRFPTEDAAAGFLMQMRSSFSPVVYFALSKDSPLVRVAASSQNPLERGTDYTEEVHPGHGSVFIFPGRSECFSAEQDVTAFGVPIASVMKSRGASGPLEIVRDGVFPVSGHWDPKVQFNTCVNLRNTLEAWVGYVFMSRVILRGILYQEGIHFQQNGGWFDSIGVQVLLDKGWSDVEGLRITPKYLGAKTPAFATYCIEFEPVASRGIRVIGKPGGLQGFISLGELRVFGTAPKRLGRLEDISTRRMAKVVEEPRGSEEQAPAADWLQYRLKGNAVLSMICLDRQPAAASESTELPEIEVLRGSRWHRMGLTPSAEASRRAFPLLEFRSCYSTSRIVCDKQWIVFPAIQTHGIRIRVRPEAALNLDEVKFYGITAPKRQKPQGTPRSR